MVRFHRLARTSAGKGPEATQWAKEIADYISANYSQTQVQAYAEQFGDFGTLHWTADFESLASVEEFLTQLQADEEYMAVALKGADLLIEGSVKDTLMTSL